MFLRFTKNLLAGVCSVAMLWMTVATAQGQTANAVVHGAVTDPDTAIIPGATVTLTPASGNAVTAKSGSDGVYRVTAPAGVYTLTVAMPGFATYSRVGLKLSAGQSYTADAKLIVGEQTQVITVTSEAISVSVDADSNASSTVIKGKDLDALSDDPDELSSELTALAGPAAGPNGGQIYVDGFTGGQLPPKSSIREIRVNQNPFSAEYDRLGFGRIEVFTKPGTDKVRGSLSFQGNDNVFNTSNPFLGAANVQPPYYRFFLLGNITGPLGKHASYSVGGSRRIIQTNVIVNPTGFYSTSANTTTPCPPGTITGCANYGFPATARAVFQPQLRQDITPRLDFALGPKNVLTVRYQYEGGHTNYAGETTNTPLSGFSNSSNSEHTIQISDTQTFSPRVVNETRFEYQRETSSANALSTNAAVTVQGTFSSGGAGTQRSNSVESHIELQNYTSVALGYHFIRFGGRLRTTGEDLTNVTNANGAFTYNYLLDPCTDTTASSAVRSTCANTVTPCSTANLTANNGAYYSSYQCGLASQFRLTRTLRDTVHARETDLGVYVEDDWKIRPNLTLSTGLRYEFENVVANRNFAPRVSVAYGVPRAGGKAPVTVIRSGFGIFYDRFALGDFLTYQQLQLGNLAQQQLTVTNPNAGGSTACRPDAANIITACNATASGLTSAYTLSPSLRSGYIMQGALGVDQQIGRLGTISVNYLASRGNHQYLTRLSPTATQYLYQYQSTGVFRQQQLFVNANVRLSKITAFGFVAFNSANSNTSGSNFIPTSTDPRVDYGRAAFSQKLFSVIGASYTAPFKISLSPFLLARSGAPYNITTGTDVNRDSVYNDRPAFANGSSAVCSAASSFTTPAAGAAYSEIPINYCTGPAQLTFNLRAGRTFGFGPRTDGAANGSGGSSSGGDRGRHSGGMPGMGGPGGGGRGGDRGGFGGGATNTGHRYNLTLGAQAQNLFNIVPYAPPVSTLTSTRFGTFTSLTNQFGGGNNAVRTITLQATLNF